MWSPSRKRSFSMGISGSILFGRRNNVNTSTEMGIWMTGFGGVWLILQCAVAEAWREFPQDSHGAPHGHTAESETCSSSRSKQRNGMTRLESLKEYSSEWLTFWRIQGEKATWRCDSRESCPEQVLGEWDV